MPSPVIDELTAARIRHALRELEELDPMMVAEFLDHPKWGPLLRAALDLRRRWACPMCGQVVYSAGQPAEWVVLTPFTRVESCDWCALGWRGRPARQGGES